MPELALAGAAALVPVALGLLGHRRLEFIQVFVLSTAAVIVVYQGAEARFWLPTLPFLLAYGVLGARRMARWRPFKLALILYAAAFVAAGGVWLADSIRLSTAGDDFPRVWAPRVGAPIAASYRVAYGRASPGDRRRAVPLAVELLRRHEPATRGRGP